MNLKRLRFLPPACLAALPACALAQREVPPPLQPLVTALAAARAEGCGQGPGPRTGLRPAPRLAQAAAAIAGGQGAAQALQAAGYRATRTYQVAMSGQASVAEVAQTMTQRYCQALTAPELTDVGVHQQGSATWIVLAAPFTPPAPAAAREVSAKVLQRVNEARARPRTCGNQPFQAAAPLQRSAALEQAAAAHAREMAEHSFMAHEGRDGSSAADRVTRAGYRWRSVGENVAAGQPTADAVVRDWSKSPEHCANLMNPGFTEMGVAFAVNPRSDGGIYWAQTFGRPR